MDRLQMAVARAKEKKAASGNDRVVYDDYQGDQTLDIPASLIKHSESDLASRRIVASNDELPESATFRLLRTKILSSMRANGWRTIAISTPAYGQGKSTVAANLAAAIAMEVSQSVLIVDLDLRRPNLHNAFGLDPDVGLTDVLQGRAELSDALLNIGSDRLTVLPGKGTISNSSEWLSDPAMNHLFSQFRARNRSRYIIYDMPPLLKSDDVLKSVKNFDCLLLVVEDGSNTAEEMRQSLEIVKQTNFVGYVLNKANILSKPAGAAQEGI